MNKLMISMVALMAMSTSAFAVTKFDCDYTTTLLEPQCEATKTTKGEVAKSNPTPNNPDTPVDPENPDGPGKDKSKGNNGHGNDPDHNDNSNPGHSNDPSDNTDADGTPGNSGKNK